MERDIVNTTEVEESEQQTENAPTLLQQLKDGPTLRFNGGMLFGIGSAAYGLITAYNYPGPLIPPEAVMPSLFGCVVGMGTAFITLTRSMEKPNY